MPISEPLLAYFSPETLLPVGSILATVFGVAMMLGRGSLRFLIRSCKRVFRPSSWIAGVSRPHFRLNDQREPQPAHSDTGSQALETSSSS